MPCLRQIRKCSIANKDYSHILNMLRDVLIRLGIINMLRTMLTVKECLAPRPPSIQVLYFSNNSPLLAFIFCREKAEVEIGALWTA